MTSPSDLPDFTGIEVEHFVSDEDCHRLMGMFGEVPWTILLFQTGKEFTLEDFA